MKIEYDVLKLLGFGAILKVSNEYSLFFVINVDPDDINQPFFGFYMREDRLVQWMSVDDVVRIERIVCSGMDVFLNNTKRNLKVSIEDEDLEEEFQPGDSLVMISRRELALPDD